MSWLVLTNSSPGAPRNSGTNGDLCTLLDWALPQAGWAVEYTASNSRVYRPGIGNRFRLHVRHDSAISGSAERALVRGCEGASSATAPTDTFPTASQIADISSNWLVSITASTVNRPFRIYLSETFVYYFSQVGGVPNTWSMGYFGDYYSSMSDAWGTVCLVRNSSSNTVTTNNGIGDVTATIAAGTAGLFFVRDITGATKSTRGVTYASGSSLGLIQGTSAARGGYQNRVYREKVGVTDFASVSTSPSALSIIKRGWLPNLWNPLHNGLGALLDTDTFTDTAYNPIAVFRALGSGSTPFCIMEETDTWSPPSG